MMFVRLTDLKGHFVVINTEDIECVHVGNIDRKGNTATIVELKSVGYICVSEGVREVAELINSPMFLTLWDNDLSAIVFNIEQIELVFSSLRRKTKGQTVVECRSGNCYVVFEDVWDISTMLLPKKLKTDN